jgi:hypothetical protein
VDSFGLGFKLNLEIGGRLTYNGALKVSTFEFIDRYEVPRSVTIEEDEETSYEDSNDGVREVTFLVKADDQSVASFQLTLRELRPRCFVVKYIGPNDGNYLRGIGVPDALLPWAKMHLGANTIESSKTLVLGTTDRRSPDATKMWQRLCDKGLALYSQDSDRYALV